MKKFLVYIFFFLCLAAGYDCLLGFALDYFASRAKSGQALKNHEIAETAAPDVLILGSSRASHHYVPDTFEDSLGLTAYVAGQDGNGIILMDPVLHHVSSRRKPKMVIYDITPKFDIYDDDPHTYLRYLRLLWGKDDYVDSVIGMIDPTETVKLQSNLFRYNSSPLSVMKGYLKTSNEFDKGYSPLYGSMDTLRVSPQTAAPDAGVSTLKLGLFREIIKYCQENGIKLYFAVSPHYSPASSPTSTKSDPALSAMIEELKIPVLDYFSHPAFADPAYYQDDAHLNHFGAEAYTDSIIARIRRF